VNERQVNVSEPAVPEGGSEADLVAALQERNRLLEAALAAKSAPADASGGQYDLDEVYVQEGQGTCLQCSCEQWRQHPQQGGPACWLCGHDRGLHKRHPDGAQARP
jgi:hypothetical protein